MLSDLLNLILKSRNMRGSVSMMPRLREQRGQSSARGLNFLRPTSGRLRVVAGGHHGY
jgi:hypothetical protein